MNTTINAFIVIMLITGNLVAMEQQENACQKWEIFSAERQNYQSTTQLIVDVERLESFSKKTPQLLHLKRLVIRNHSERNDVCILPPELGRLTLLHELVLRCLRLQALPAEMNQLTALKRLNLQDNNIDAWPYCIERMRSLEWLDFSYNQLKTIPDTIQDLSRLETLNLVGNPMCDDSNACNKLEDRLPKTEIIFGDDSSDSEYSDDDSYSFEDESNFLL